MQFKQIMNKKKIDIVGELIYYSYANLAMAHTAIERNQEKYGTFNYMIRAKLFKGLKDGTMNMKSIFDDEKIKLTTGNKCNYCGSDFGLTLDHIFPKSKGGLDHAENLIFSCKSCNSSKGNKDLMEWMYCREDFLPILVIRRYLKLVHKYCLENNLLNCRIDEIKTLNLPFNLEYLPMSFPTPKNLKLNVDS